MRHLPAALAVFLLGLGVGWVIHAPGASDRARRAGAGPDPVGEVLREEFARAKSVRVEYALPERPGERVHRTLNTYRVQPFENHLPPRRPSQPFDWMLTLHAGADGGGEAIVSYLLAPSGEPYVLK
jgi:hypothetical protein